MHNIESSVFYIPEELEIAIASGKFAGSHIRDFPAFMAGMLNNISVQDANKIFALAVSLANLRLTDLEAQRHTLISNLLNEDEEVEFTSSKSNTPKLVDVAKFFMAIWHSLYK